MYELRQRTEALELLESGLSLNQVSTRTGISRAAIREWRDSGPIARSTSRPCHRCAGEDLVDPRAYAALLGFYLGDGHVSRTRSVHYLRVACDPA